MRTNFLLTAISTLLATAAHGANCNLDLPLQWVIQPVYVDGVTINSIQSDGSPYIDGQSGNTVHINICSGTGDATLLLGGKRRISMSFSKPLALNSYTPSWARSGNTITGGIFLNIRNVMFVPAGMDHAMEYSFTTTMGSTLPSNVDGNFRMLNPNADAPPRNSLTPVDTPYPNSLVMVHHCPAGANTASCPNIVHETWFVYPDTAPAASETSQTGLPITQVGGLLVTQKGKDYNGGEFSMPFYFQVSMLN